jgi:hypothetical protein
MSNLAELHETARYFVGVTLLDEKSLEVSYPSNIMIDPPVESYTIRYIVTENSITKQLIASGSVVDTFDIYVPDYAKRIIIMADIMIQCRLINIGSELIFKYKDGEKLAQDETVIDMLERPKDRYSEMVLFNIFNGSTPKKDCAQLAEANNISDGYNLLLTILELGGL